MGSTFTNHRARPLAAADRDLDPVHAPAAPISAARLAAEAAFAAPALFQPTRPTTAHVTVRRARLGPLSVPAWAGEVLPSVEPQGKAPRVFRLDAVHATAPTPAAPAAAAAAANSTPPAGIRRRRRVATDKLPGQVLHVIHIPTRQPEPVPAVAAARPGMLSAELARVAPVLQAIQRAQSFVFIDDSFEQQWERLSLQADVLLVQLRALGR